MLNARKGTGARKRLSRAGSLLREALRDEQRDYTVGPTRRALLLLAIPMMLEMSMESVFALVDIFFVAQLGADAVAAVGITEAMLTILYAVAIGLSLSATAMVARRIGEKNAEAAALVAGQSIWIGVVLAALMGVGGALHADALLGLMGAPPSVIEQGGGYTAIMFGGSATIFYLFLLNAVFRGAGDATIALRSLWLANGINIVLDPCLIFGLGPFPEMGVTGAAVATNIGRGIGIAYQLWHLADGSSRVRLAWRHLRIVPSVLFGLLRVSLGGIGQFLIATSSWLFMMRILTAFGSNAIAGFTIALRLIEFVFLPAWGLSNAAATVVGQNLGAGRPDRAVRSTWQAMRLNLAFLSVVALAFVLAPEWLVALFTADPEVAEHAATCLRIVALGYPLYAVGLIMTQALNGAGDTFTPSLLNLVSFWLVQIPLAWWLAHGGGLGYTGVAWSIMIAESLLSVLGVLVVRRGRWKATRL